MSRSDQFLEEFIQEMKRVMEQHDSEKGCTWPNDSKSELVGNLYEEIREFEIKDDPLHELVDIACSSYILWAKNKYY